MFLSGKLFYQKVYNTPLNTQKGFAAALNNQSVKSFLSKFSVVILLTSSLVWTIQRLNNTTILPVRHIKITGHFPVSSRESIKRAILPFTTKGLLHINVPQLKAHLNQWSWIESVTVTRLLPSTVKVYVKARQPIAKFCNRHDGVARCIDKQGYLFECENDMALFSNLPDMIGSPHDAHYLLQLYQRIVHLLDLHAIKITRLKMDAQQRVSIQLDNGIQVYLGHYNPLKQLQKLLMMHPFSLYQSNRIASIDLRYPNGIAIKFHESRSTS
jgi:cell division protein FtsQ